MAPIISPLTNRRVDLVPDEVGLIQSVMPGSVADEIGIMPGDRIVAVDGQKLVDALDFQYRTQNGVMTLAIARGDRVETIDVERGEDEPWGLAFSDPTFDGVRVCENACPFCFIKQIPKGMRKSLYVMDDDYRHSMMFGNFVTLTNLTDEDWQRIEEQRLGPFHVSVHSTNPELRVALVGNPKGARILEDLTRLERAGIDFHAQLVLCPGVNDGAELDRSLEDLSQFKRLISVAAVPVGLTKHGLERQSKQLRLSRTCIRNLPGKQINVRRYLPEEALAVIRQAEHWQERFRHEKGRTFFLLGDEFYLMTGLPCPSEDHYDGFPQIEDGIGITRHLLSDLDSLIERSPRGSLDGQTGVVGCGTLIGPTMDEAVERFNAHLGSHLEVKVIENHFLGPEINVSGLLTGSDLVSGLRHKGGSSPVYVSSRTISDRTHTLLDDMTIEDVARAIGRPLVPSLTFSEVFRDLRRRQRQLSSAA
jgi:putative radical SAM enzyme (TIGR03279 family)